MPGVATCMPLQVGCYGGVDLRSRKEIFAASAKISINKLKTMIYRGPVAQVDRAAVS
jgi:hypothetical protein